MTARRLITLLGAALALLLSSLACCFGAPEAVRKGIQMEWPWTVVRGSGETAIEQRSESGFDAVALRGIGTLYIEQGDEESVEIEAEDNLLPYLETRVEGTKLIIGTKSRVSLRPTRPVIIRVTMNHLDRLEISGSGDADGNGLSVDDLAIVVSGSGNVELSELDARSLRVRISGSGTVSVSGAAEAQNLTISGSGDYRSNDLATAEASVRITGSGSADISASDSLEATISGSGSVRYWGSPTVESTVTGSGSIRQAGE